MRPTAKHERVSFWVQSLQMPRIHSTYQVWLGSPELRADSWVKGCWAYLRAKYPSLSAQPRYHSPPDSRALGPTDDTQTQLRLWRRNDSPDFELTEVLSLVCSSSSLPPAGRRQKGSACSLSPRAGCWLECSVNFLQIASFHLRSQQQRRRDAMCLGRAHYTSSIGAGMPPLDWLHHPTLPT